MSISIAMTTYLGERYLQAQLDSFRAQTLLPDELVVCDDGSDDGTVALLERFRQDAPFDVRVHRNETNLGLGRNFEKALRLCRGDLVFLSDQDDVWAPEKLRRVVEVFAEHPDRMLVLNDQHLCDGELRPHGRTVLENLSSAGLDLDYFVPGCSTAVRREWLDVALPLPDADIAYDTWINRLGGHLGLRTVLAEPLQYYRRHGGNASADITSMATAPGRLDLARSYGGSQDVQAGWRAELASNEQYVTRLGERRAELAQMNPPVHPDAAVAGLRARSRALRDRLDAVGAPRLMRPLRVAGLLAGGGYRPFQGWRSAARDLAR